MTLAQYKDRIDSYCDKVRASDIVDYFQELGYEFEYVPCEYESGIVNGIQILDSQIAN